MTEELSKGLGTSYKEAPEQKSGPAIFNFLGMPGRFFLKLLLRPLQQCAFLGRLCTTALRSLDGPSNRQKLLLYVTVDESLRFFWHAFLLILITGLIVGFLWSIIWFRLLSNAGGADNLMDLLVSVQMEIVNPFFASTICIVTYMGPMTMDLAILKSTRQFETLSLMGIPPIHFLTWPKILASFLVFPVILFLIDFGTAAGVYLGAHQLISLRLLDFADALYQEIKEINRIRFFFQSVAMSLTMCFFSLFNAFEINENESARIPFLTRRAMMEAFFFCTLAGVLVTLLYA
ncbi:MAG: ABC transporter permease [Deltaproteobacteria bacterium]|nr:ABC transporter permease [Deltaproteobacteria bacterium]